MSLDLLLYIPLCVLSLTLVCAMADERTQGRYRNRLLIAWCLGTWIIIGVIVYLVFLFR